MVDLFVCQAVQKAPDPADAIAAAIKLFWKNGFEASSMADLVKQMKINRQSVYDTYGDKRAAFMEALQQYKENVAEKFRAIFSEPEPRSPRFETFPKPLPKHKRENNGNGRAC